MNGSYYGPYRKLFYFEYRGKMGTIGTVPADNIKEAWKFLLNDLERVGHHSTLRILKNAKKKKVLKKLIKCSIIPIKYKSYYRPADPPH